MDQVSACVRACVRACVCARMRAFISKHHHFTHASASLPATNTPAVFALAVTSRASVTEVLSLLRATAERLHPCLLTGNDSQR
jgi:hypothetical protein